MGKLFAVLAIVVIASVTTTDGISCPDGCTDCLVCQHGFSIAVATSPLPARAVSVLAAEAPPVRLSSPLPGPIDHPPRTV